MRWSQNAPVLDAIKRRELVALDHQAQWPHIDALLQWTADHAVERTSSGLLEQQRLFRRYWHGR